MIEGIKGKTGKSGASYRELFSPPDLRAHVECFWVHDKAPSKASPYPVLPDGCADVVALYHTPGRPPRLMAVGTMTRPLVIPAGEAVGAVGVRLRPGRVRQVFGVPAAELTDRRIPLLELLPSSTGLADACRDAETTLSALAGLLRQLLGRAVFPPPWVDEAVRQIRQRAGMVAVAELGAELGLTRQSLARGFAEHVGISPKTLARVARLQAVLGDLASPHRHGWASLALARGYYDQAHLIDEFRTLTGLTPERWLDRSRPASVPFSQDGLGPGR